MNIEGVDCCYEESECVQTENGNDNQFSHGMRVLVYLLLAVLTIMGCRYLVMKSKLIRRINQRPNSNSLESNDLQRNLTSASEHN